MFTTGPLAIISSSFLTSLPFRLSITCMGFIGLLNTTLPSMPTTLKY